MLIKKYLITFVLALVPLLGFANEQSNGDVKYNLENCLIECYHFQLIQLGRVIMQQVSSG